jgi:hypothetical protein
MYSKKIIIFIILILIAVLGFSLLSKIAKRKEPQSIPTPIIIEKSPPQVQMPAVKEPAEKKPIVVKERVEVVGLVQAKGTRSFWGNRGYLIKDGKSTFVKPSLLEQLRRDYEQEQLKPTYK